MTELNNVFAKIDDRRRVSDWIVCLLIEHFINEHFEM